MMSDLYWLTDEQMARLRCRDAPKDYGPHKTLYNRWKRWGDKGVFLRIDFALRSRIYPLTIRRCDNNRYVKLIRVCPEQMPMKPRAC